MINLYFKYKLNRKINLMVGTIKVKMLYAAQKLLARIFSNCMTFPDFYSSKSWCNF